jgi:hypothetical protein
MGNPVAVTAPKPGDAKPSSEKGGNTQMTGFHPVWDRKYHKYFNPVQILRSWRFISIPMYKMRPASMIFEFQRTMAHQQQKVFYSV